MNDLPLTPSDIARQCWGDDLPDWVAVLARECEMSSQAAVAARLDRSAAMISQILRRKYPAGMGPIEERVRGVLMNGLVDCPALGSVAMHECQDWRAKAEHFKLGNPMRVRMFHLCNRCPRKTGATVKEAAE